MKNLIILLVIFIIIYSYQMKNKKEKAKENNIEDEVITEEIEEEIFDEPLEQEVIENPNLEKSKMDVEAAKYKLIEERENLFFNKKPLPSSYLVNEVVLIPKNTDTLYAYWEVREDTFNDISNNHQLKSENPIIILKNIQGIEQFRIQTHTRNGNMYINNVNSNNDYIVLLGFLDIFDNFIEIAHSTEANVPNPNPSNNFNITWGVSEVYSNENNKSQIFFKKLDSNNIDEYLGFKQEILDNELINGSENSKFKGLNLDSDALNCRFKFGSSEKLGSSNNIR